MWNLFLAWLPAFSALVAYNVYKKQSWLKWLVAPLCALVWLIFFPKALYLVTDLIHLRPQSDAPFWFDLLNKLVNLRGAGPRPVPVAPPDAAGPARADSSK